MLQNGLGELLSASAQDAKRFVDLFAGSGAVAVHVARNFSLPVLAIDLQRYSAVLTGAIIQRDATLNYQEVWTNWYARAIGVFHRYKPPQNSKLTRGIVLEFRDWCERRTTLPITRGYGGHYFSPSQAVWFDALRSCIPPIEPERTVALATLLHVASRCAASPGHTAQPLQPTRTAKPFILDAWNKNVVELTKFFFADLSQLFALTKGSVQTLDANDAANEVREGDLVFIDPPYSGVHYSRFYHVFESIVIGGPSRVSGIGRYPDLTLRPRSRYSLKTESRSALSELFEKIAVKKAKAIVTFPEGQCSNGLSGGIVRTVAREYFRIREKAVESKFSTLGGTADSSGKGRAARQQTRELIFLLTPK